jgi:hypothetical protein
VGSLFSIVVEIPQQLRKLGRTLRTLHWCR